MIEGSNFPPEKSLLRVSLQEGLEFYHNTCMVWELPGSREGGLDQCLAEMRVKVTQQVGSHRSLKDKAMLKMSPQSKFTKLWQSHPPCTRVRTHNKQHP